MTADQRHRAIVRALAIEGALTYEEIARRLEVSQITARRDVETLAGNGEVIRILGGAQRAHAPNAFYETAISERLTVDRALKQVVARQALSCVEDGMTLFIDGSSTCIETARILNHERTGLTVVTPSALVAMELGCSPRHSVVLLGGSFDPDSCCTTGPMAEDELGAYHVDMALLSTKGFVPAEGTFESILPNIRVKRIAADHSQRVALLVDHSKFGTRALCKALSSEQVDLVVTDEQPGEADLSALQAAGVEVLWARLPTHAG